MLCKYGKLFTIIKHIAVTSSKLEFPFFELFVLQIELNNIVKLSLSLYRDRADTFITFDPHHTTRNF